MRAVVLDFGAVRLDVQDFSHEVAGGGRGRGRGREGSEEEPDDRAGMHGGVLDPRGGSGFFPFFSFSRCGLNGGGFA